MQNILKQNKYNFLLLLFFVNFFFPTFHVVLDSSGAIVLQLIQIVFLTYYCLWLKIDLNQYRLEKKKVALISLIFFYYFFHLCFSTIFSKYIILSDLFELQKPFYYLLCVLYFFMLFDKVDIQPILRVHVIVFLLVIFFGILQLSGVLGVFSSLYTKSGNYAEGRVTIPFVNPYDYAFIITFVVLFFFNEIIVGKFKIQNALLFLLSLMLLFLTQSKAGYLFAGVCLLLNGFALIILRKKLAYRFSKLMIFIGIIALAALFLIINYLDFILDKFAYVLRGLSAIFFSQYNYSFQERLRQFNLAIEMSSQSPFHFFFGNGVSKTIMKTLETIYTFYIFRYGFFGLFLFFVVPWVTMTKAGLKTLKKINFMDQEIKIFFLTAIVWFACVPVASFGNAFTEQIRLSFFYLGIGFFLIFSNKYVKEDLSVSPGIP